MDQFMNEMAVWYDEYLHTYQMQSFSQPVHFNLGWFQI